MMLVVVVKICAAELDVAYYDFRCPDALAIVQGGVHAAMQRDARAPASLLRLHFHDCFVNVRSKVDVEFVVDGFI